MTKPSLILVLGDQLTTGISSLGDADPERDIVVMAEVADEATYVAHHKKKIAFIFAAMRHFAKQLEQDGWRVLYTRLDDPDNTGSLGGEVARHIKSHDPKEVILTEPGEWRLLCDLKDRSTDWPVPCRILEDDRFIASHQDFDDWAEGRKQLRMEYFYRDMRRKTGLLMEGDDPVGGKWNFDAENRKPPDDGLSVPRPKRFTPDDITSGVLDLVETEFADNFGTLDPFWFAVTRKDALGALDHFVAEALPNFGDFQDAMLADERFLFHSILSQYIHVGLLDPIEVCRAVERAYHDGDVPLNAAEGFIRQIIGWREYVRGIYWREMPGYTDRNFFDADRDLPAFYWTGETDMACMRAAITQTRDEAYAHHIQRLMVTGNFAMLAGVDPHQVHEWYLAVYADAYEWVEAPNTIGMSQFADGGLLGSKPYAASGNYINKMSDYCNGCAYDVKRKTGEGACPFNPLYWDFLDRNQSKLRDNPRMGQMYSLWDRMGDDKKDAYRGSARAVLDRL
ncbi:cryptochrome/photolyase family protein [Arenibacterium sp. CAU 1754]